MAPILKLNKVLHLGMVDADAMPAFQAIRADYFKRYHQRFWTLVSPSQRNSFRGEALDEWVNPISNPGDDVKKLQTFLSKHGFMPGARLDGVFGYWTLAAVRLFQEYVRTIEGKTEIGIPDGRVGNGTHEHMMRWEADQLYAEWGPDKVDPATGAFSWTKSSREYDLWMELLPKVKSAYQEALANSPDPATDLSLLQLQMLEKYPKATDTRKLSEWSFDRNDIHLIGLRCNHEIGASNRGNDDLFVLLMNGMVFKFWGSTDPQPAESKTNEPYLIEGQHKYRLSWHRVSSQAKVYKALVPYNKGVLVFRDWNGDDALSEDDIRQGLEFTANPRDPELNNPNGTINIHWTFDGKTNWSAGCQVISGRSYLNNRGRLINCAGFSAGSYDAVSAVSRPGVKFNRGAYTFVSDFVFSYAPQGVDYVVYTLGRDGALEQFAPPELLAMLADQDVMSHLNPAQTDGLAMIQGLVGLMKDPRSGMA